MPSPTTVLAARWKVAGPFEKVMVATYLVVFSLPFSTAALLSAV